MAVIFWNIRPCLPTAPQHLSTSHFPPRTSSSPQNNLLKEKKTHLWKPNGRKPTQQAGLRMKRLHTKKQPRKSLMLPQSSSCQHWWRRMKRLKISTKAPYSCLQVQVQDEQRISWFSAPLQETAVVGWHSTPEGWDGGPQTDSSAVTTAQLLPGWHMHSHTPSQTSVHAG